MNAPSDMVIRDVLDGGLRLITETMPHVRSVTIGVWLTRGSRHESDERGGIAHFVEHMLFKGTDSRSAEDIAQAIDSIGGQLDAFTAKEYASYYYIKVLDEHVPLAVELLSDIVRRPAFVADEIEREKKVILEEIKMVEDTPDDLVHELFTQHFWEGHPLARPILGSPETVEALNRATILDYFGRAYVAPNMIISAAGPRSRSRRSRPEGLRRPDVDGDDAERSAAARQSAGHRPRERARAEPPLSRHQQLSAEPRGPLRQLHPEYRARRIDELAAVPEHPREARPGLLGVQRVERLPRAGNITIYAGCANEAVGEVIDLCVEELKTLKRTPVPDAELRRAKDHLKGSLMLSLENTASRMSHLARQEIYFDRHFGLDETLAGRGSGQHRRHPARGRRSVLERIAGGDRGRTVGAGAAAGASRLS